MILFGLMCAAAAAAATAAAAAANYLIDLGARLDQVAESAEKARPARGDRATPAGRVGGARRPAQLVLDAAQVSGVALLGGVAVGGVVVHHLAAILHRPVVLDGALVDAIERVHDGAVRLVVRVQRWRFALLLQLLLLLNSRWCCTNHLTHVCTMSVSAISSIKRVKHQVNCGC